MKYVKMLGLAAATAMALTALFGASSASATVLCKTYETPCAVAWTYGTNLEITATLQAGSTLEVRDIHEVLLDTCTGSTIVGKTTEAGTKTTPVVGPNESETFTGCTGTTTVIKKGGFKVNYLGPFTKGEFILTNDNVTFVEAGISCTYGSGAEDEVGVVESDESTSYGEINFEGEFAKEGGSFLCPAVVFWTGKYLITKPGKKEIYIKQARVGE
jgi:hypothetical protein